MHCAQHTCKRIGKYGAGSFQYCAQHFLYAIEHRIRKDLRKKVDLKKKYALAKTPETALAKHFLDRVYGQHLHLHPQAPLRIYPLTLETYVSYVLTTTYLHAEEKTKKPQLFTLKDVLLMQGVRSDELVVCATLLKIPYKPQVQKTYRLIAPIESKHPGTLFALKKSSDALLEVQR